MKLEEAKEARRQLQDRVDECETALSTARQSEATLKQTVSEISGKNTQLTHELSATSELVRIQLMLACANYRLTGDNLAG
jgi:chromosome segregation ATPase